MNTNTNLLIGNSWQLQIPKFANISYFLSSASLPEIKSNNLTMGTRNQKIKIADNKIEFDDLDIEFFVDEKMENYRTMYNYLIGLSPLQSLESNGTGTSDYINTIGTTSSVLNDDQDISLIVYDNYNNPVQIIQFHDAFPTSLSVPKFETNNAESSPMIASVRFSYSWFEFA